MRLCESIAYSTVIIERAFNVMISMQFLTPILHLILMRDENSIIAKRNDYKYLLCRM